MSDPPGYYHGESGTSALLSVDAGDNTKVLDPPGSIGTTILNTYPPIQMTTNKLHKVSTCIGDTYNPVEHSITDTETSSMTPEFAAFIYEQAGTTQEYIKEILEPNNVVDWKTFYPMLLPTMFQVLNIVIQMIGNAAFDPQWLKYTVRFMHLGWYIQQYPNEPGVTVWEPPNQMFMPQRLNQKTYVIYITQTHHAFGCDVLDAYDQSAMKFSSHQEDQGQYPTSLVQSPPEEEQRFPHSTIRLTSVVQLGPAGTTCEHGFANTMINRETPDKKGAMVKPPQYYLLGTANDDDEDGKQKKKLLRYPKVATEKKHSSSSEVPCPFLVTLATDNDTHDDRTFICYDHSVLVPVEGRTKRNHQKRKFSWEISTRTKKKLIRVQGRL